MPHSYSATCGVVPPPSTKLLKLAKDAAAAIGHTPRFGRGRHARRLQAAQEEPPSRSAPAQLLRAPAAIHARMSSICCCVQGFPVGMGEPLMPPEFCILRTM